MSQVKQLVKKYGALEVVHGVDFEIGDGEFVVLVGPSGCGKSTILRMIAGLEPVTGGEIVVNGRVVNDDAAARPRHRHGLPGLRALPAHDRAAEPRLRPEDARHRRAPRSPPPSPRPPRSCRSSSCSTASRRSSPAASASASPSAAPSPASPQLFLFDEPLSNLDAKLRVEMRTQIKRLHMAFNAHQRLRHPRPDRGDDARRPHRRPPRRPHRAGRHARRPLRPPGQPLRRRLHRLADDELPRRPARRATATASRSCRTAARRCRCPPPLAERYAPHAGRAGGLRPPARRT